MTTQMDDHFDSTGHGVNPGSDIWPGDVLRTPSARVDLPWAVRVFVLSPIKGCADEAFLELIRSRVQNVARRFDLAADAVRVDKIVSPGSIHQAIWENMRDADIIVCNLTGHKPNVIYELGVAAAYLPRHQVIVLQEREDTQSANNPIPFNLKPLQVITHGPDLASSAEALQLLDRALEFAILRIPFARACVDAPPPPIGQEVSLRGTDFPWLCIPHLSHRRVTPDGLEFGAPRYFGASWASYGNRDFRHVRVTAQLRFLGPYALPNDPSLTWIGIAVRASHYYATQSHLYFVSRDGTVRRTAFEGNGRKIDPDPVVHEAFDPSIVDTTWFNLSVEVDDHFFSYRIGIDTELGEPVKVPLSSLDYVFATGRVLIQSYNCRVVLRSIHVEEL